MAYDELVVALFGVTVHGASVILSEAKNLSWIGRINEILRFAQNDGVSRPVNSYASGLAIRRNPFQAASCTS